MPIRSGGRRLPSFCDYLCATLWSCPAITAQGPGPWCSTTWTNSAKAPGGTHLISGALQMGRGHFRAWRGRDRHMLTVWGGGAGAGNSLLFRNRRGAGEETPASRCGLLRLQGELEEEEAERW